MSVWYFQARILEKLEYSDLQGESSSTSGFVLNITDVDRYLKGPTPEAGVSYQTSDEIITVSQTHIHYHS